MLAPTRGARPASRRPPKAAPGCPSPGGSARRLTATPVTAPSSPVPAPADTGVSCPAGTARWCLPALGLVLLGMLHVVCTSWDPRRKLNLSWLLMLMYC